MKKQKFFAAAAAAAVLCAVALPALAQVDVNFDPNKLIDDKVFSDTQTFGGSDGVQKFLETKNSVLANTSEAFLVKLKEPDMAMLKQALDDPEPNLGRHRTAAQLIWDASVQSGLNPQVILVTLEKEQSLITGRHTASDDQLQTALDHALGFDCPDSSGCGNLFPGFYYQLFGNVDSSGNRYLGAAKSLMKSFNTPGGRGPADDSGSPAKVGETLTIHNTQGPPYNAPESQQVTISNNATAALYRFTPHVFNGNYNFWKFFNSWFKYPNGTVLGMSGDVKTYVIQNGSLQLLPDFVARARGISVSAKITVSPNEFATYPLGGTLGPADNTVAQTVDGKLYVFIANTMHPVSSFVLNQRGLSAQSALSMTASDAALFSIGPVLTPSEGTVLRGQTDPTVYMVQNGMLAQFSASVFSQRKVSQKSVVTVPDNEIATYQKQGYVPPLDGTLVKAQSSPAIFLVDKGLKRPVTADVFKNQKYSYKNVAVLADAEVSSIPIGAYAAPKDYTFFAVETKNGPLYEFKEGTKHAISSFVAKQRGITPDYTIPQPVSNEWFDGIPVPPRDGTLIKGSSSGTIYLVKKGQLDPITAAAFKKRGYSYKKVSVLPQEEVDSYAKGDTITK